MLLDHLPEGAGLAGAGRALVHHRGGAIGERAIHDVAVAGDPAHIGGAPVDVVVADVEDPLEREVGPEVVAGGGVHHPLGLAGGAGGVEHKQPVFTGHRLGRALGALGVHQRVPPVVAALLHGAVTTGPGESLHHEHVLDAGGATVAGKSLIHSRFQGHGLVLAEAAIGGDHRLDLAIDQPVAQGIGREAAEHHRVGRTDAGAGEHGDGRFRHHRHVESHQIPLTDAQGLERIGGFAHFGVQLAVAEAAAIARLPLPDQGRLVGAGAIQVAIEAVEAEVGGAPLKPLGKGRVAPIEHRVKRLKPVQLLPGQISPKAIGISLGFGTEGAIGLHRTDAGPRGQLSRWRKQALFLQHRLDRGGLTHGDADNKET